MKKWRKTTLVLTGILVALVVPAYILAAPRFHQDLVSRIAFYPGPEPADTEAILATLPAYERLSFDSHGRKISALLIKNSKTNYICLFSHGNAGSMIYRSGKLNALHAAGLSVLIYDYGGFGKSSGHSTLRSAADDGASALHYLLMHGYKPEQVVLYGESIGGGITSEIAKIIKPRALVLDSTFTSPADWVRGKIPLFHVYPDFMLSSPLLNNVDMVRQFKGVNLLIFKPGSDDTIPVSHSQKLYDAAAMPKTMVTLPGSPHAIVTVKDYKLYSESLKVFADSLQIKGK